MNRNITELNINLMDVLIPVLDVFMAVSLSFFFAITTSSCTSAGCKSVIHCLTGTLGKAPYFFMCLEEVVCCSWDGETYIISQVKYFISY